MSARAARPFLRVLTVLASLGAGPVGCTPELDIGNWKCSTSTGRPEVPDGGSVPVTAPIEFPWSTGFEDGFCDYVAPQGYCYFGSATTADGAAGDSGVDPAYELVAAPVHQGKRAAAFRVTAGPSLEGRQARCVREGTLPIEAYYGAWFYVPAYAYNGDNWNLMHFEQGDRAAPTKLWDVSIATNMVDKTMSLYLYDFASPGPAQASMNFLPARWFHVEFYWRQATDGSGEVDVLQDGTRVIHRPTTTTSAAWSRWYVGDLVDNLTPPDSTVYVDDVSISAVQ